MQKKMYNDMLSEKDKVKTNNKSENKMSKKDEKWLARIKIWKITTTSKISQM